MKKVLIVTIFIVLLAGCDLLINPHPPIREHDTGSVSTRLITLTSLNIFAVNGRVYTTYSTRQDVTIYNPNMFVIDIIVVDRDKISIAPHRYKKVVYNAYI